MKAGVQYFHIVHSGETKQIFPKFFYITIDYINQLIFI